MLASESFSRTDPGELVGRNRLKDIASLILQPGAYTIVGYGYGAGDRNGNVGTGNAPSAIDDGGGLISFVGGARFGGAGAFPGSVDGGPPSRYFSGTFEYQGVPEPATMTVLLVSGAALIRRRRKIN